MMPWFKSFLFVSFIFVTHPSAVQAPFVPWNVHSGFFHLKAFVLVLKTCLLTVDESPNRNMPLLKNLFGLVWTILVIYHRSKSSKVIVIPFWNQHILLMEFNHEATAYVFVTVKCGDCNVEVLLPSAVPIAAGSSTMRTCNNHVTETHLFASNTVRLEKQDSPWSGAIPWGNNGFPGDASHVIGA